MRTGIWSSTSDVRDRLEAEFVRILGILDARSDIDEVWRFGSMEDGEVHATSDLDVLVVQRTDLDPVERGVALRVELAARVPLDLFVVTPQELAEGGRFLDHVRSNGRRVR